MIIRVHADADGETHLTEIEVAASGSDSDGVRKMQGIPTTTLGVIENVQRKPPQDYHPAPRRQLVIVGRGGFEITTTSGECRRFGPGDCLFADDVGSRGHRFEDLSSDGLMTFQVGIEDYWEWPTSARQQARGGSTAEGT